MMEAASLTARLSPHLTCRGLSLRRTKIPAMRMTSPGRHSIRWPPCAPRACPVSSVKPSVLVLGATGMLGHVVVDQLGSAGFDVHASIRDRALADRLDPATQLHDFDATRDSVAELIEAAGPRRWSTASVWSSSSKAASKPLPAISLNALFPHEAAAACELSGARFVHISTDCVFSGSLPLGERYTEEDTPDARDLYGLTKYLGEVSAPRVADAAHLDHRLGARSARPVCLSGSPRRTAGGSMASPARSSPGSQPVPWPASSAG